MKILIKIKTASMTIKNIFISICILSFTMILSSCTMYKEVTIKDITQVRVVDASSSSIKLEVYAVIDNPNFYDVKIEGCDLKVSLEDSNLGTVNFDKEITIPAGSQESHVFPVELKPEGLLSGAVALFKIISKNKVRIKIKGTVNAKAMFIDKVIEINTEKEVDLSK